MTNRKAMILAAGLGTRLYPLTKDKPKALVEYQGKTLLQIVIEYLKLYGFNNIIINVHHFAEMIIEYLELNNNFGVEITISDETKELLETGGGLKKASWFFDSGPFLVHNVDVISDINLSLLYRYHINNDELATLAVNERESSRPLLMSKDYILSGWKDKIKGEEILIYNEPGLTEVGFSGIYVLNPNIFNLITEEGKFSIIPPLIRIAASHRIGLYLHKGKWSDMGKINDLKVPE